MGDCANWKVPTEGHRRNEPTDEVIHSITFSDDRAKKKKTVRISSNKKSTEFYFY